MKILIILYSRTGNTRRVGQVLADELNRMGCQVTTEQLVDTKSRKGFLGWLGGVKDALLKRPAGLEPVKAHMADFDLVAIGTPMWAGTATPAVLSFLRANAGQINKAAFFCTSGGSSPRGTFASIEKAAGRQPVATLALTDRHVKKEHPEKFLARTAEFARAIAAAPAADQPATE
jgi:flavodoxin